MGELSRTGISLEHDLLEGFDALIAKRGYKNRSEAVRDLIREALAADAVAANQMVVGTLTLVYDHHVPNLAQRLTEAQHHGGAMVLATTHVHLDHHACLEVILLRGQSEQLKAMADQMLAMRGVELGKLVMTKAGLSRNHAHDHDHPEAE